ncbi:MAG: flagellin, partial [Halodesulfurarchaeum sp.]
NVRSATSDSVNVTVENTGSEPLNVDETDVLLDGTYQMPDSTNVSDHTDPDIWAPGEELTMNISYSHSGTVRVRVVTGPGVADFEEVTL